jgi:hypothetical protein
MLADYIATLPLWERDLLAHATEDFCPEFSLHELLQQGKVHILVASDGERNTKSYGCKGIARGYQIQSYRAEGYVRPHVPSLVFDSIRFYDIQPADDLRVTAYCDNSSLLTGRGRIPHPGRGLAKVGV